MAKDKKMMQGLGKEYADPEQRKRFLKDNADSVEQKTYMKPFTPEQLQGHKEMLANTSIEINDIEEEAKAIANDFKQRLKPLKEQRGRMIENIRAKAELVTEVCFKFVNDEERMTYFYNENGDCIEARQCTADELQKTMFQSIRLSKTGTDDK